jgi:L-threonylcarbamoyladenylate synthase
MDSEIDKAVAILARGGLVAFPTETVYGLGADASNPQALTRLYAAKGRPVDHPVIVHLAEITQLSQWARDVTPAARKLAQKFWPRPLTLIVSRAATVSDAVTGGQDSVGVRIPSHPVAHSLLKKFGTGVAAPSANRFGRVSPTTAAHVREEFGNSIDLVLDGGPSDVGIESTIVDVTSERLVLVRPGHILAREIEEVVGMQLSAREVHQRAPGTLATHYAPNTPLLVVETDLLLVRAMMLAQKGNRVAVLAHMREAHHPGLSWFTMPLDAVMYARELYARLRSVDNAGFDLILIEKPPTQAEWAAVNDRIYHAAAKSQLS